MKLRQEVFPGLLAIGLAFAASLTGLAQINTGSDGHDGVLNPTSNRVINMADHPDGIYHYTSVNIPANVTVTFIPNASNTPVVWLVQSNIVINGTVDVSGNSGSYNPGIGGLGGPGGYRGGAGGASATAGQGPGGGLAVSGTGGNASFGSLGQTISGVEPGPEYGNSFLLPLIGGSGGGGTSFVGPYGGGGGGGAILIAAAGFCEIGGLLASFGGQGWSHVQIGAGGAGSGGAIRIIASRVSGRGRVMTYGNSAGGGGRVRFDTYESTFGGSLGGQFTLGSQFIIFPSTGQLPQLTVIGVGGVSVSAPPTGVLSTPDAVLAAQQANPIPIVVRCSNLPLGTPITVSVKPVNSSPISAVGYNNSGTVAESTATVSLNMPRGGGIIYATAATSN